MKLLAPRQRAAVTPGNLPSRASTKGSSLTATAATDSPPQARRQQLPRRAQHEQGVRHQIPPPQPPRLAPQPVQPLQPSITASIRPRCAAIHCSCFGQPSPTNTSHAPHQRLQRIRRAAMEIHRHPLARAADGDSNTPRCIHSTSQMGSSWMRTALPPIRRDLLLAPAHPGPASNSGRNRCACLLPLPP